MKGPGTDSEFFASAFGDHNADPSLLVPWEARAVEVGAKPFSPSRGMELLVKAWARDRSIMGRLDSKLVQQLHRYLEFSTVEADRDVIRQDEYGNFMIILLEGAIAVDRLQPWGETMRLAEIRAGEVLGEMSLLDGGTRFSICTTLSTCHLAVLRAEAMDDMMTENAQLAGTLIALLARKLSLRLRAVGARLSEKKEQ